ncbi:MAG: hypothetical protein ACP5SF_00365 [Thermoplasmata archaeon]
MINPIDLISEMERNAKNMINKGNIVEAKKTLYNAFDSIKNEEFLYNELPDLAIILKKIFRDFLSIKEYDYALKVLILINNTTRGKIKIINEIKEFLKNIPEDFGISRYDKEIREISKNQWEIVELLNEIERIQKNRSN